MPLFKFENGTAKRIGQKEFSNEKELHELIDDNLEEIFNLRYIKDEYVTEKHGRIETLVVNRIPRGRVGVDTGAVGEGVPAGHGMVHGHGDSGVFADQ